MSGFLALEDGTVFHGESVGAEGFACGAAVPDLPPTSSTIQRLPSESFWMPS